VGRYGRNRRFCVSVAPEIYEALCGYRELVRELLALVARAAALGANPRYVVELVRDFVNSLARARGEVIDAITAVFSVKTRGFAETRSPVCIELAEKGIAYCVIYGARAWAIAPDIYNTLSRDLERGYATTRETSTLIEEMERAGALVRAPNGRLYLVANVLPPK